MRTLTVQTTLWDIYDGVSQFMQQQKPKLVKILEKHIDFQQLIPAKFRWAFYSRTGRNHIYHLKSFVRTLVLERLLGIPTDSLLLSFLHCAKEFHVFCGVFFKPFLEKSPACLRIMPLLAGQDDHCK